MCAVQQLKRWPRARATVGNCKLSHFLMIKSELELHRFKSE